MSDEPLDETPAGGRATVRAELAAAACFGVAMLAALALAVIYWEGGQNQAEGVLLAVTTGGIGVGIVLWAKHFLPGGDVEEEREPLPSSEDEVGAFQRDYEAGARALRLEAVGAPEGPVEPSDAAESGDAGETGEPGDAGESREPGEAGEGQVDRASVRSRRLLLTSAVGALTAFGAALLFPIRSLGPRPGGGLKRTPYAAGRARPIRVVLDDGTPLRPNDLSRDGVVTVWPEGHTDAADAPTLLIRTRPDQDFRAVEGRESWTVEGVVAYSKLCTHVGCPVGLYQSESGLLLCPCHQSTFDVLDGARPVFGPAARSLPQLPLDVDDEGYLVAKGDFSGPVGPGFWDRGR
jgi:ubiquinol-cytochrome c reductase iron-sulfur subunit